MSRPSLLLISNFLLRSTGTRGVCDDLSEKLSAAGWHVATTSSRTSKLARLAAMLYACWKGRNRYDIALIDVFSGSAFLWAEAAAAELRRLGKPYILTLHGGNLPAFAARRPRRVRRLLRSSHAVTTPSRYLQTEMARYRGDLILLPNALDVPRYAYRRRDDPKPVLVWLRKFHRIYNPALAVEVLAALAPLYPDIRLIMTGPDKGDGSLGRTRELAGKLGVSDRLTINGAASAAEVPMRLNEGSIFLNTTNFDNAPVSVLEAMACGLCVVSTNVGGLPYLLESGRDSLLVGPRDPAAMAGAVHRVLQTPGLAGELSARARRKIERFDWSAVVRQWEDLILQIGTGRTGRRPVLLGEQAHVAD